MIAPRGDGLRAARPPVERHGAARTARRSAATRPAPWTCPTPDGPVSATRVPGAACEGDAHERGAVPVRRSRTARPSTRQAQRRSVPTRRAVRPPPASVGAAPGSGRPEHLEHPRRRRLPLGAGVELGAGAAQGDEDLGRDQQDRHGRLEAELAPEQPQPEHHGDEPDAEPGDQVHGRARTGRRRAACAWWRTARLRSPPRPRGAPAPRGRRRAASAAPRRAGGAGRRASPSRRHCRSERRVASRPKEIMVTGTASDQRHDDHEGQPVLRGHPGQQEDGDDGGRRRLGEVARVVGVERAQPPGGGERELAGALAGQPARPERQRVARSSRRRVDTTRSAARCGREVAGAVRAAPRATRARPTTTMAGVTALQRRVVQERAVDGVAPAPPPARRRRPRSGRRATSATPAARRSPGTRAGQLRVDQAGPAPPGGLALTG